MKTSPKEILHEIKLRLHYSAVQHLLLHYIVRFGMAASIIINLRAETKPFEALS